MPTPALGRGPVIPRPCKVGILVSSDAPQRPDGEKVLHARAIERAGGTPVFLHPGLGSVASQHDSVDAVLIPGGGDVDPVAYGADARLRDICYGISPEYDRYETEFIQRIFDKRTPMLAVCRGQQITNVAAGGGLHQDLPSQVRAPDGSPVQHSNTRHEIDIVPGSKLAQLLDATRVTVNSFHHQAVALTHLSPLLVVTARALDGVVEAVQKKDCDWQIGVQFHPEMMMAEDPRMQGLYDNLVQKGMQMRDATDSPGILAGPR